MVDGALAGATRPTPRARSSGPDVMIAGRMLPNGNTAADPHGRDIGAPHLNLGPLAQPPFAALVGHER